MDSLLAGVTRYEPGLPWQSALVSVLAAFVCCHMISSVYSWTYRGLSFSRGFVISLTLGGIVAAILMLAIGDSIARGLGILGALAIVRFRTNVRDTRDMMFVFVSLAIGIAAGVQALEIAVIGTVFFCLVVVHLTFAPFAKRQQFDGLLRLNSPSDGEVETRLKHVLREHCSQYVLVNLREVAQGERLDQSYQIKLREPSYQQHLVSAIGCVGDVSDVSLLMQDAGVEV